VGSVRLGGGAVKNEIARAIAGGHSQQEIARSLGVRQSTISRMVNKDDVRALIEAETLKLLEAVPQAVENIKDLVKEMPEIPKKKIKRRELAYKASADALKTAGMLPTPIQTQTLVNIIRTGDIFTGPLLEKLKEKLGVDLAGLLGKETGYDDSEAKG
jgi:transcriptional regulator with XRE-family HTH domain